MAIVLVTCRDYSVIRELRPGEDVSMACWKEEERVMDGYAVVASENGWIIADADGMRRGGGGHVVDAATATGMYDRDEG